MLEKIKKRVLISIAAAGILYLAFTVYADFNDVAFAFGIFNWLLLPVLLILSLLNYFTRFFKWHYYLHLLKVKLKWIDSLSIFLSGLIMSITPGKFGELLKSYLVKQVNREPISKTAPIIFAERLTDFISLVILSIIGAYIYDYGREISIIIGLIILTLIIIISNKYLAEKIFGVLSKIKFFNKHLTGVRNAYESSYKMLKPLPLLYMTIVSIISWGFEGLGYYIILINFNVDVTLFWALFSYSFATIIGAVSMLPGGLGVTEGSLTFMIIEKGASKNIAVASTFLIRAVTLWFAVLIGVAAVGFYQKRFGKLTEELNTGK